MGVIKLNDTELFYDTHEVAMIYQYLYDLGCKFSPSTSFQDSLRRTDITQLIAAVLEKAQTEDNSEFSKIEYASRGLVFAVLIKTHQLASDTRKQWSEQVYGSASQGQLMGTYRDHVLQAKESMLEYIDMLKRDPPSQLRISQSNYESVYEKSRQAIETMDMQGNMFWHELNTYFGTEESAWSQMEAGEHLRYRRNLFTKMWGNFDSDIQDFSEWKKGVDSNLSEFEIDSSDDGYSAVESVVVKDEIPDEIIAISEGTELGLKKEEIHIRTSTPINMRTPSLTPIYVSKYARKRHVPHANLSGPGSPTSKRLSGSIKQDDMSILQAQTDNSFGGSKLDGVSGFRPPSIAPQTGVSILPPLLFDTQTPKNVSGAPQIPQVENFQTHSPMQTTSDLSLGGLNPCFEDERPGTVILPEYEGGAEAEVVSHAAAEADTNAVVDTETYDVPETIAETDHPPIVTTIRASALPKGEIKRRKGYRTRARLPRGSLKQSAKQKYPSPEVASLGTEHQIGEPNSDGTRRIFPHRESPIRESYHSEAQDYGGFNNDVLDAEPIQTEVTGIEKRAEYKSPHPQSPTDEAVLDDDFTEFLNTEYLNANRLYENVAELSIDEVIRGSDQGQRRYSDIGIDINRPDNRPRTEGKQEYDNDFTLPEIEEHDDLENYHNRPQFTSDNSHESIASVNEAICKWMNFNDTPLASIDECYKMLPFTETSHKLSEKDLFFAIIMGDDKYIEPVQETVSYICPIQLKVRPT